jgi:NADP-dependent 3-hydroxy acid dehydrogenase YdfG
MRAIITGASSGIGKAIAIVLAKKGWQIASISRREEAVIALQQTLISFGSQEHLIVQGDLCIESDNARFRERIAREWTCPDLIVNNAGSYIPGAVGSMSLDELDEQMNINFRSGFQLVQYFVPRFKQLQSGRIVFIGSVVVQKPRVNAAAYTLSKVTNDMYAKLLCEELRDFGVGVTRIFPGSVNTATWGVEDVPRERFVQPEDIAQLVNTLVQLPSNTLVEEMTVCPTDKNW